MRRLSLNLIIILAMVGLIGSILLVSCDQTIIDQYPDLPTNPFENLNPEDGVIEVLDIDSSSFLGIHYFIFERSCAQPGCHDGHFEPDFRTIQSAYNTLAYHPVIKNDADESFEFRVVPGDKASSWLYERVSTDDAVFGRMPLYDTLSEREIELIGEWIDEGAKDIFGNSPNQINNQPNILGWLAFENDTNGARLETFRADHISPIQLLPGTDVQFWFLAMDIDENGDPISGHDLDFNKVRFSDKAFDFDDTPYLDLDLLQESGPFYGDLFFSQTTHQLPYFHYMNIDTDDFVPGRTYYVRVYVQDADHDSPTEWPNNGTENLFISLMSFVVL